MNDREMADRMSSSVKGLDAVVGRIESGQGALGAWPRTSSSRPA
jgi:hypothetical protein